MSPRPLPSLARAALATLVLAAAAVTTPWMNVSATAAGPRGTYVVQGVPGTMVDVTVDGNAVQSGVKPKQVIGPLDLAAGRHTVAFKSPDWTSSGTVSVAATSQDVVVHWPADPADRPEVTVFANNLKPVVATHGRLTVAHTAVVPPADIVANGKTLFTNIANGEFVTADVPADTYEVSVVPTGGGDPLLGPVALPVKAGALTRVFAIGAPRNGSMDAVVQVLPLSTTAAGAPTSMPTGSAGLVSTAPGRGPGMAVAVGVLALLGGLLWRRHASR
jgi:hypothetical protein